MFDSFATPIDPLRVPQHPVPEGCSFAGAGREAAAVSGEGAMARGHSVTLARRVVLSGVGLHSGAPCRIAIGPAAPGAGLTFFRTDRLEMFDRRHASLIPARIENVARTTLCTGLRGPDGAEIALVEHVLAALAGLEIDDAEIWVDGPEIPILDGSAAPFCDAILAAGLAEHRAPRTYIRMLDDVRVALPSNAAPGALRVAVLGPRRGRAAALPGLDLDIAIDFANPVIGRQTLGFTLSRQGFVNELSFARTFGFAHEVEHLRAAGLARGGSMANSIVFAENAVLNPEGLRRADECVRHKLLDAIGDLALAGAPIWGHYAGEQPGHALNAALLRALRAAPEAWTLATIEM